MPNGSDTKPEGGVDEKMVALATVVVVALLILLYVLGLLLWLAGQLSGVLAGHGWPDSSPADVPRILVGLATHPGDPGRGWPAGAHPGPGWLIYVLFLVMLSPIPLGLFRAGRFVLNWRRRREFRLFRLGFASGNEIRQQLSASTVLRKAKSVRPSTRGRRRVAPREVGFFLGRDIRSRQELYGSVEDVFVVLAPPRQGKDVHFCAPFTIDAPGACIVTSTRADAFTNTYTMRAAMGKVYVFDPNGLTHWPERLRWSPVRDCENPDVASNRATAIVTASGFEMSGDAAYWVSGATIVLRCFLHAAALGQRTVKDVLSWAVQQTNPDPVNILRENETLGRAVPGWAGTLEASAANEPRSRAVVYSLVVQSLSCFSDPRVLEACSPGPDEIFDLKEFLSGRNTLYVLGKEQKNGSVAPVVTAMMEDLFEGARKIASRMPNSRMDPPLTVELNEAAHIAPMPNLPGYMGDSGGFSISLHVYLQSLSQARSKWGDHEAMIMWDNAAVRIIMGGAGNIEDLEDISRLMGEIRETRPVRRNRLIGVGGDGGHLQVQKRRVLAPDEVRTLKFGTAVVVARAARPVEATLTPWWKRPDGKAIAAGKTETEQRILRYSEEAAARPDPFGAAAPPAPPPSPESTPGLVPKSVETSVETSVQAPATGLPPGAMVWPMQPPG